MGGLFSRPSVDTRAQEASLRRQEELLAKQQERLEAQERQSALREHSARAARLSRLRGRAVLLGGDETGTSDQPLQARLGG